MKFFARSEYSILENEVASLPTATGMLYKIREEKGSYYLEQFCTIALVADNANRMFGQNLKPAKGADQTYVLTDTYGPYNTISDTKQAVTRITGDLEEDQLGCIGPNGHPKLGPLGEWL